MSLFICLYSSVTPLLRLSRFYCLFFVLASALALLPESAARASCGFCASWVRCRAQPQLSMHSNTLKDPFSLHLIICRSAGTGALWGPTGRPSPTQQLSPLFCKVVKSSSLVRLWALWGPWVSPDSTETLLSFHLCSYTAAPMPIIDIPCCSSLARCREDCL